MNKFCKDCKYFKRPSFLFMEGSGEARCMHPSSTQTDIDIVIGKITKSYRRCHYARMINESCGPEGKLWEPK